MRLLQTIKYFDEHSLRLKSLNDLQISLKVALLDIHCCTFEMISFFQKKCGSMRVCDYGSAIILLTLLANPLNFSNFEQSILIMSNDNKSIVCVNKNQRELINQFDLGLQFIQWMFPSTNKDYRQIIFGPSPKHSRDANKSTYLPYFKRFPHQKFMSQQKKRHEEVIISQPKRFFTEQKQQTEQQHDAVAFNRLFSNSNIKERLPQKLRPKLYRQIYERESNRMKRGSEQIIVDKTAGRLIVNSSFNVHHSANYLTPSQVLRSSHNLTSYELEQIQRYSEIYYYGQNCIKKLFGIQKFGKGKNATENEGYPWVKGDHISYRYEIIDLLGEGSFGQVFKCIDYKNNRTPVAVKMVKNNEKYLSQAKIEIKILNIVKSKDPLSSKNCIQMKDHFSFRNRTCMIFNLLSLNLYELVKSNGYYGLPLDLIRRFVLQILNGIHFLHQNKIIHADLKPENILLKEMNKSGIKIIDFGSSCLQNQTIYTYIQSRYYRAPEVILGLSYDRKIDIWSFGCIIAELHLGYPLFGGQNEHEQICLIVEVLGMPPEDIIPNSKRWSVFFDHHGRLKEHNRRNDPASKELSTALQNADQDFVDFIRQCLEWNPDRRIEALQLMKHNWVLKDLPTDFKNQHLKFVFDEQSLAKQQSAVAFRKSRKQTFSIRDKHRLMK